MGTEQHVSNLLTFCVPKEIPVSQKVTQGSSELSTDFDHGLVDKYFPSLLVDDSEVPLGTNGLFGAMCVFQTKSENCHHANLVQFWSFPSDSTGFSQSISVCPLHASGSHITLVFVSQIRVRLCTYIIIHTGVQSSAAGTRRKTHLCRGGAVNTMPWVSPEQMDWVSGRMRPSNTPLCPTLLGLNLCNRCWFGCCGSPHPENVAFAGLCDRWVTWPWDVRTDVSLHRPL